MAVSLVAKTVLFGILSHSHGLSSRASQDIFMQPGSYKFANVPMGKFTKVITPFWHRTKSTNDLLSFPQQVPLLEMTIVFILNILITALWQTCSAQQTLFEESTKSTNNCHSLCPMFVYFTCLNINTVQKSLFETPRENHAQLKPHLRESKGSWCCKTRKSMT